MDDFLFIAFTIEICTEMMENFLNVCEQLGVPVLEEKTEWPSEKTVFLGMLLDGRSKQIAIPVEKKNKALQLLHWTIDSKKVTIKLVQQLTGTLNFLNRAIVPDRAFMRMMYSKLKLRDKKGRMLKQYHHVTLDKSFKLDCRTWVIFLNNCQSTRLCRPFIDWSDQQRNTTLRFYSDASRSADLGMGAYYDNGWIVAKWNKSFIEEQKPSIEFLELYALTAALLTWSDQIENGKFKIFCDNDAVVHMVNNLTSSCHHCMKLIRIIALEGIIHNRKICVRHVRSEMNVLADALSRLDFKHFWKFVPTTMKCAPEPLLALIWHVQKLWFS